MPSRQAGKLSKPWVAKTVRNHRFIYLGHFATKEEAAQAEQDYALIDPPKVLRRAHSTVKRPYSARRYRNGINYSLGAYATSEEARTVEKAFDALYPRRGSTPPPRKDFLDFGEKVLAGAI